MQQTLLSLILCVLSWPGFAKLVGKVGLPRAEVGASLIHDGGIKTTATKPCMKMVNGLRKQPTNLGLELEIL